MYATVLIALNLPLTYSFAIAKDLQSKIKVGQLVEVSLNNTKYAGIVSSINIDAPVKNITYQIIKNVLSDKPIVLPIHIKFWQWIAKYYMCSEGEVFTAAVPNILKFSSDNFLQLNAEITLKNYDCENFTLETNILNHLKNETNVKLKHLEKMINHKDFIITIKKMLDNKTIQIVEQLSNRFVQKQIKHLIVNDAYLIDKTFFIYYETLSKKPDHAKFLLQYWQHIKRNDTLSKNAAYELFDVKESVIIFFIKNEVLKYEYQNISRLYSKEDKKKINITYTLSDAQLVAYKEIKSCFDTVSTVLLFGLTASGKTEIYAQFIKEYLNQGKQILYLLPEIALTNQMINRLNAFFEGYVFVYHSKINEHTKKEIWDKVFSKEPCIILGARSASFLPFTNLGLSIIDEEHDASFKQSDPAPRYNARDIVLYNSVLHSSKVLLGSATPSLESLANAEQNKIGFVKLTERYNKLPLPDVQIIDMKKCVFTKGDKKILSPLLKEKMFETLQKHQQILVFQNKRGYASYIMCETCGAIPYCKNCDVSLTLHLKANTLKCHYCSTKYKIIFQCNICKSNKMIEKKFATEQIETHLNDVFPDYKTVRLDADTAKGKKNYEAILEKITNQEAQILVGTQMIIKGLNFENIGLVAIVDGDSLFNFSDFRVSERAFQTIQQVSGRAGRKNIFGKVYIQLYQTEIPFLKQIIEHQYLLFCKQELIERKQFNYPPYSRLLEIVFKHINKDVVVEVAENFKQLIPQEFKALFIGPSEPIINRIKNKYLMSLLVKLPKNGLKNEAIKLALTNIEPMLYANSKWRSVVIQYNVDL